MPAGLGEASYAVFAASNISRLLFSSGRSDTDSLPFTPPKGAHHLLLPPFPYSLQFSSSPCGSPAAPAVPAVHEAPSSGRGTGTWSWLLPQTSELLPAAGLSLAPAHSGGSGEGRWASRAHGCRWQRASRRCGVGAPLGAESAVGRRPHRTQ
ncbi:hypothetical protein NDU88_001191 [Pleurodeles waltl]|uniref:Uncharacterized protein n=1 Tax=Pleurodeles waltl TaxID=8319 RepID=A0AAV7V8U9_PLEWA|nr:hypothetical protein NDU88_001191 [Pleurodeles waltl]